MKKQTLFILGGNGAIGSAIVERFKANGFEVFAPVSNELDLSDLDSVNDFGSDFDWRAVDVVINCAGYNTPELFLRQNWETLLKTLNINTLGFVLLLKKILPYMKMRKSGYVLGISSLYGFLGRRGRSAYALAKHGLNGFLQTLALECGEDGILVNVLSPGFIDTPLTRRNLSVEKIAEIERKLPLSRLGTPADIASVAYFLCSSANTYITGQNIIVDGGYSAGGFEP